VIGGEFLAVGSAEYEYFFSYDIIRNWGLAAFVDAGDAFRRGEFDLNVGAGLGIRWRSPLGMVRVDVARSVHSPIRDAGFRLHLVIGPDL
jgi:translocation and assembly module TamA